MEEIVKKRGRKKTVLDTVEVVKVEQEEQVKKKRGRKKKWETTPFKNNYTPDGNETVKFEDSHNVDEQNYNTNALNFGNLCIKVHDKETEQDVNLDTYFVETKDKDCELEVSSDEEDTCNVKKENKKSIRHYDSNLDITSIKLKPSNIRCFNCHHCFQHSPFFLPFDYSSTSQRYKLFGNFCSPNCVKSYCINNKSFQNKSYLVGQFYRKLFGPTFSIKPAPSVLNLKEYGGKLSIEEFRKSFYTNSRYTISNINCKIVYVN